MDANITIDTICGIMNSTTDSPLDRYAEVNDLMLQTYQRKCTEFKYDKMIKGLRETSWDSEAAEGGMLTVTLLEG